MSVAGRPVRAQELLRAALKTDYDRTHLARRRAAAYPAAVYITVG